MTLDDDDNIDSWDRWWQLPGFPPMSEDDRQRPRGMPGRRSATERLAGPPASFIIQRLLYSANASADESRLLLFRLREDFAGRQLVAAAQRASELRAELAHHGRQLEAARLHAMADVPAYEDEVAEARATFERLVAACEPWLALAPTSAEHADRETWSTRVAHAEQVERASSEPAAARGQVIQLSRSARRELTPPAITGAAARVGGESAHAALQGSHRRHRLDQASFLELMKLPDEVSVARIEASLAVADVDGAAVRALVRVHRQEALPLHVVGQIVARLDELNTSLVLVRHAYADTVSNLTALLDDLRVPLTTAGTDRRVAVLFAVWHLGGSLTRTTVRRWTRRSLRSPRSEWATELLAHLVGLLDDPDLRHLAEQQGIAPDVTTACEALAEAVRSLCTASVIDTITLLPYRCVEEPLPGGVARAAPKVGPNEPCPCGSGKKRKRCHAEPRAGEAGEPPSRARRLRDLSSRVTPDQIYRLAPADLAMLDPDRLSDASLVALARVYAQDHDWNRARGVLEQVDQRPGLADRGAVLHDELLTALVQHDQIGVAAAHMASLPPPLPSTPLAVLTTALAEDAPDALAHLRATARQAVADASGTQSLVLANVLLAYDRSLGILVARGALRPDQPDRARLLVERIEVARDDLLLPPGDPAAEHLAALSGLRSEHAAGQAETARLVRILASRDAELAAGKARVVELEREVAQPREALARVAPSGDQSAKRTAELREKVAELEALVRTKNEQLAELRRTVPTAAAEPSAAPLPRPDAVPAGDSAEIEEAPAKGEQRSVLVTHHEPRAAAAIARLPRKVAAQAARMIGSLAAGDTGPWASVKQAKDMPRQVLMFRVGIHHRLLFRVEDGVLEVIDVVTREELETTLKRLRER